MKIFNASNHSFNPNQLNEIKERFNNAVIIELQPGLKQVWGQLNPYTFKDVCDTIISEVKNLSKDDEVIVHVAGFPAAVNYLCKELKDIYVKSIYAYSIRNIEEVDGVKKSVFKHSGFFYY